MDEIGRNRDTIDDLLYGDEEFNVTVNYPNNDIDSILTDINEIDAEQADFSTVTYNTSVDQILNDLEPPKEFIESMVRRAEREKTRDPVEVELDASLLSLPETEVIAESEQGMEVPENEGHSVEVSIKPEQKKKAKKNMDDEFSYNNKYSKTAFSIETALSDEVAANVVYKVIIVGESGVGKSNLLCRWIDNKFINTSVTLNVEISTKLFTVDGIVAKVQLWDTAGQEQFRSVTQNYYRSAMGAILTYDITRMETFNALKNWFADIKSAPGNELTQVLLIGNKTDLEEQRQVSTEQGIAFAKSHGLNFMETSAFSGNNVNRAFQIILQDIHNIQSNLSKDEKNEPEVAPSKKVVVLSGEENNDKKSDGCPC